MHPRTAMVGMLAAALVAVLALLSFVGSAMPH
jgi:hypothetical protein